jgi:hydrogenase maturation factor
MAELTSALEKPSLHQFENSVDLKQHEKIADAEASSLESPTFEGVDEHAVLRKMDIRLIPMLSMLYLLAFLDRGNIGNAKIEGLVDDLHMTGPQYNWTCMNLSLPLGLDFVETY